MVWLEKILAEEDAKRRKARAAKKAGGATVSGATAASVGGVSVGTATSATGETVDQTHVWITGVPFEYPMESIKEWFSVSFFIMWSISYVKDHLVCLHTEEFFRHDTSYSSLACISQIPTISVLFILYCNDTFL